MVAHLDAVTSLAVDPNGLYLLSGSKYKHFRTVKYICKYNSVKNWTNHEYVDRFKHVCVI